MTEWSPPIAIRPGQNIALLANGEVMSLASTGLPHIALQRVGSTYRFGRHK